MPPFGTKGRWRGAAATEGLTKEPREGRQWRKPMGKGKLLHSSIHESTVSGARQERGQFADFRDGSIRTGAQERFGGKRGGDADGIAARGLARLHAGNRVVNGDAARAGQAQLFRRF